MRTHVWDHVGKEIRSSGESHVSWSRNEEREYLNSISLIFPRFLPFFLSLFSLISLLSQTFWPLSRPPQPKNQNHHNKHPKTLHQPQPSLYSSWTRWRSSSNMNIEPRKHRPQPKLLWAIVYHSPPSSYSSWTRWRFIFFLQPKPLPTQKPHKPNP